MYNADEFLQALEPPTIRLRGKTYQGRILDIHAWERFQMREDMQAIQSEEATLRQAYEAVYAFAELAFPRPLWRRLPFVKWVPDWLIALPPKALLDAASDFFASQARAMGIENDVEDLGDVHP